MGKKQITDPIGFVENKYHITLKFHAKPDEYVGPCPLGCNGAGEDRWHLWTEKQNFWCRQCGAQGFLDELDDRYAPPDEATLLKRRVERLERQQKEHERRLKRLEEMHKCTDHILYHKNLTEERKEYWYEEGIFDYAIESFKLGYANKCPLASHSPSYTIPVYDIENRLCNIRHRLIDESRGKYRPHRAGLPQQLFNAPILTTPQERVLLLEGEKKSICYSQYGFPSVGLMGKSFKWRREWFDWFRGHSEIIIALDPDALENAFRLGELFSKKGFDNVSVARFPVKPDDAINLCDATKADIERILSNAKKIRG